MCVCAGMSIGEEAVQPASFADRQLNCTGLQILESGACVCNRAAAFAGKDRSAVQLARTTDVCCMPTCAPPACADVDRSASDANFVVRNASITPHLSITISTGKTATSTYNQLIRISSQVRTDGAAL